MIDEENILDTEVIRELCRKYDITYNNVLILGRGSSRQKNGRYQLNVSKNKQEKHELKYAVQYCKDLKAFVAWNLQRPGIPIRTKYSVKAIDVEDNLKNGIEHIKKHIEYSGWNEEDVLVFRPELIDEFLKKYVK